MFIISDYRKMEKEFSNWLHVPRRHEPRARRPPLTDEAVTVKKLEDLILADRRVTIQMIMQETHPYRRLVSVQAASKKNYP